MPNQNWGLPWVNELATGFPPSFRGPHCRSQHPDSLKSIQFEQPEMRRKRSSHKFVSKKELVVEKCPLSRAGAQERLSRDESVQDACKDPWCRCFSMYPIGIVAFVPRPLAHLQGGWEPH